MKVCFYFLIKILLSYLRKSKFKKFLIIEEDKLTDTLDMFNLKEKNFTHEQIIGKSLQYLRSSSELEAVEEYPVIDHEKCTGYEK